MAGAFPVCFTCGESAPGVCPTHPEPVGPYRCSVCGVVGDARGLLGNAHLFDAASVRVVHLYVCARLEASRRRPAEVFAQEAAR